MKKLSRKRGRMERMKREKVVIKTEGEGERREDKREKTRKQKYEKERNKEWGGDRQRDIEIPREEYERPGESEDRNKNRAGAY